MNYQRARIMEDPLGSPGWVGKVLWVESGAPQEKTLVVSEDGDRTFGLPVRAVGYRTNIFGPDGGCMNVPREAIELLAEFSEDVPPVTFDEWAAPKAEGTQSGC
jgi:hypothetical protein